jgi:hypothetical protein
MLSGLRDGIYTGQDETHLDRNMALNPAAKGVVSQSLD